MSDRMGVPEGDYASSITLNVLASEVGRVLDLLRNYGYDPEVNLGKPESPDA